ncbi:hypothetical protein K503DRAFT_771483 [Rhizopogon vinicolor AM-OR11-026]|uniref:Uncharacterized protein n=1 Tax=Rhizopogon vinicolor AM-OR11-026 TaxID=1314800 RepID=A0A1B7MY18_9AGAM|nr:hypothetical protein K503DRAFT_771483 [Rhizopogon vinicolor AM-OR11-026]
MSSEYLPLDLDDLVHIMSPSPAPPSATLDDPQLPLRPRSTSPEPSNDAHIQEMHMNITTAQGINGRGNESTDMQTSAVHPDPDQIIRQAEIISCLIEQRDMLVQQAEEQRLRWNSEKDSWARMAEALITQQAKHKNADDRDEDLERQHTLTEADNRCLRQRLHEAQSRLSILESELSRLRPLLLMQPLTLNGSAIPAQTPRARPPRRRKKDTNTHALTTEDEDPGPEASDDNNLADPEDTTQTTPKQKSHTAAASLHTLPQKRRHTQKHAPRVLTADARTEHLLLAAKRIGRQRTGILAGLTHTLDRRRDGSISTVVATPKTPKRTVAVPPGPGYVYLNSPMRPGAVPVLVPAYPHHLLQTPSSSKTAVSASSSTQQQKQQQARNQNPPPTPLDSLLSAARSMMNNDEDEEETVTGTRRSRSSEVPDSPIPKRRKIARDKVSALRDHAIDQGAARQSSSSAPAGSSSTATIGRVRSGLDVLADQAAAFSSQDQQSHLEPRSRAKGKGKETAPTPLDKLQAQTQLREKSKSKRKQPVPDVISKRPRSIRPSPLPRATVTDWGAGPPSLRPVQWAEGPAQGHGSTREIASTPPPPNPMRTTTPTPPTPPEPVDQVMLDPSSSDAAPSPIPPAEPSPTPNVDTPSSQSIFYDPFLVPPSSPHDSSLATDAVAPPFALHQRAATTPVNSSWGDTPLDPQAHPRHETAPGSTTAGSTDSVADSTASGSGPATGTGSVAIMKNKEVARVTGQDAPKRQRSPYVKWSKEEDDLLAQAVAKYGQKWDLVQKALPSRGYHQVRQRWLRKLGVFDSKPDLSSFQTGNVSSGSRLGETQGSPGPTEPPPNPKLGLAPLSSELAISSYLSGRGDSRPS